LFHAGADVTVYEAASALREIGAGINVQAVAVGALIDLGIDLEKFHDQEQGDSILTSSVEYFTSDGQDVRPKSSEQLILNHSFVSFEQMEDGRLSLHFESTDAQQALPPVACDFLVAADGLKSRVRASLLGSAEPRYTGRTIYRGLCEVDAVSGDGRTVSLCGDQNCNFICYPISEKLRAQGRFHCNWGFCTLRPHPGGVESWTSLAKLEDIREELERMGANSFAGLSPLQMAERSDSIIGWALFDRDPLETFDFGNVTLLGDAAHPLLPYGSQGATQAIMDAEALGVCYQGAMQSGTGIHGCIKAYSDLRCEVTGKVVIANREMGSTAVLKVVDEQTQGMDLEAKRRWCAEHGSRLHDEVIQKYRASMPKSVRATKLPSAASA
ncbi:phzS, partial [Symbiodinium sp. KB8]